ncbi:efflux RND transporter periplasmic adaptor subunit [Aquabacterium humicola]|uniref:efflux RND transporter periplasmic adaptor subunit n=1 Tax=Aquabacterium humicola TaxID=3237377 RepID=UPI0025427190|nr:efflux RND transporter periplasmic adaptor subunit [Rubrivivax pictus]
MSRRRLPALPCAVALAAILMVAGCGKPGGGAAAPDKKASAAQAALLLAPEDLRTVGQGTIAQGPVITGSIQPERRADLRAEVSGIVTQVLKDNGEVVKRGDLLVRLDDTAIRDTLTSAEEALRASTQGLEQAERQYQRLKTLQAQGMSSIQAMEDAEMRRNNVQSDQVAAKARVATARQQLTRTEVRAPFDGVVSDRKVSAGDTAQVGKELVKVIDPSSMRFEGLVSADRMHEIKLGQPVSFRVNGYPQTDFRGQIKRIDASANATTRQIEVLVAFAEGPPPPRTSGLFGEGRIEAGSTTALMLPEASVVREGDQTFAWRVQGNVLKKVAVKLGERDARRGEYPVLDGLAAGDRVLRNPGSSVADGQRVEFATAAKSSSAPAAAAVSTPAASAAPVSSSAPARS